MQRLDFQGFGGVRLAGEAFGLPADPAVLLLPSGGQSRAFWYGAAHALAIAGRYAICVDLRGQCDSDFAPDGRYDLDVYVADLKAILTAMPSRAFVLASGLSAITAIAAVGEGTPHLVSGLALVDATIWFDQTKSERLQQAMTLRAGAFADEAAVLDAIGALHPDEPRPVMTERILSAYAVGDDGRLRWRGDPRSFSSSNPFAEQDRLRLAAARIQEPVTLIRGSLNESTSAEQTQLLQAMIAGAETAEIEGAGHYAATDREDEFNAVLLDFLERRVPRQPITYLSGAEPRILRDALGCFGTGVTVITTIDDSGEPVGLTANSFTSVSLDPPLILFSLATNSANLSVFQQNGKFAVNVLHIGQQPLAGQFTRRDVPRFENVDWTVRVEGGSPVLAGSLASFDCKTYAVHEAGDHVIFIGRVEHAWFEPQRDPLLYFRGKYRRLHFS